MGVAPLGRPRSFGCFPVQRGQDDQVFSPTSAMVPPVQAMEGRLESYLPVLFGLEMWGVWHTEKNMI